MLTRLEARLCRIALAGLLVVMLAALGGERAFSQSSSVSLTSFTPFDFPAGNIGGWVRGINNAGVVVGSWSDNGRVRAFTRTTQGVITTFDGLGAGTVTEFSGINNASPPLILGWYTTSNGTVHYFTTPNGIALTEFNAPVSPFHVGAPVAINDPGQIVGYYMDGSQVIHSYLREVDGTIKIIDFPGSSDTRALGINNAGQIVGSYGDSAGNTHGFIRVLTGTPTTFDAPGTTHFTQILAVNNFGEMVGNFSGTGFFFLDAAGAVSIVSVPLPGPGWATTINDSRGVAGVFFYPPGPSRGFVGSLTKPDPVLSVPLWFQAGIPAFQNGIPVPCSSTTSCLYPYPGNFWAPLRYDFEIPQFTVRAKGCALLALTMVINFWQKNLTTPTQSNPNTGLPPADWNNPPNPSMPNRWQDLYDGTTGNVILDTPPLLRHVGMVRVLPNYGNVSSYNGFPVFNDPTQTLDNILRNGAPVILAIVKASSNRAVHFVVVTGKDSQLGTYLVNDPGAAFDTNGNPVRTLLDLQNTGWWKTESKNTPLDPPCLSCSLGNGNNYYVFVPIGTVIVPKDPNTGQALTVYSSDGLEEFILTDPQGRQTGFDPVTNTSFQSIPVSVYSTTIYRDEQDFSPDPPPFKALYMANQMPGQYTLNVIGTGGGNFTVAVRASDAAGNWIIQTYSGITAPGISSRFTFGGAVTTFAALAANLAISPTYQAFGVDGTFTLGPGGTISPVTQPVTIQLGNAFLATIPAGSFTQTPQGTFVYGGVIQGVLLAAALTPTSGNSYAFAVAGAGAPNLPSTNPVEVRLAIGTNGGSTSVNATFVP